MSKKAKRKPVPAPDIPLGVAPVVHGYAERFDQASGRSEGPIYNISSCQLEAEVWLFRTYRADPFHLVMRFGNDWFELGSVRADDPAVKVLFEAGHIVEYGPRPDQIEAQRAREAEKQQRREAEEAHKRARQEHCLHRLAKAEAREQRAREERQAGM